MSNIALYYDNALEQANWVLKNPQTGNVLLDQDAAFPMSNLKIPDRYTLWKASSAPPVTLDIDFSSTLSASIKAVGYCNLDQSLAPADITLFYSTGSTYPPTWTSFGSILGGLDNVIPTTLNLVRQLRFEISGPQVGMRLGKFFAMRQAADLGMEGAPGTVERVIYPEARQVIPSGIPIITRLGSPYRQFDIANPVTTPAVRALVEAATGWATTVVMLNSDGNAYEVVRAEDRQEWARVFAGSYEVPLRLASLP